MNKLFIIDSHALIYRAYYAFEKNNLHDKLGRPTGAIYGFTQYMLNILDTYKPEYIVAVMDSGKLGERSTIYPAYKANRKPMPKDLISQLTAISEILNILGISIIKRDGIEADDLIASLVYNIDCEHCIISKDKDLMQLLACAGVTMLAPNGTGIFEIIDSNYVMEKFGVMPYELTVYLSLVGDTSDNIPGVKGIGKAKAIKLINSKTNSNEFGAAEFKLSLELVQLRNYPDSIPRDINTLKRTPRNIEQYNYFCTGYDMKSLRRNAI